MMALFQKVIKDGVEVYEEVDLNGVQLPATHPVVVELEKTKIEAIKKRDKLKALRDASKDDEDEGTGGTPAAVTPKPAVPAAVEAVDLDALVEKAAGIAEERFAARQAAQAEATSKRDAAIDGILKETGLDKSFRGVVAAIPDLAVAKAQATVLAAAALKFDQTPNGENGSRDVTGFLAKADELLGNLPEKKK